MPKTLRELGRVIGNAMTEMSAKGEAESWQPRDHVYYRVTITSFTKESFPGRIFGFTREIVGHDVVCCTMPDGSPRTLTVTRDGHERKVPYCLNSGSRISDEEAMSLVKKGQGSVYKVTEHIQRLK